VGGPPKFWTDVIKFGLLLITMQNFMPVASRAQRSRVGINK